MQRLKIKQGQRFGRLVVIGESEQPGPHRKMRVECDCGAVKAVRLSHLTSGQILSCGCHRQESRRKHGMYGTKIYRVWAAMIARCNTPTTTGYENYGGRGIRVCDRWHDFRAFFEDMRLPPQPEMEIDRIDNDGNYEPANCRWTTSTRQKRNSRKRQGCTSQYRGVCWSKQSGKWHAEIKVGPKRHFLGQFHNEEDAARAYDAVAHLYKGFRLNFPQE